MRATRKCYCCGKTGANVDRYGVLYHRTCLEELVAWLRFIGVESVVEYLPRPGRARIGHGARGQMEDE